MYLVMKTFLVGLALLYLSSAYIGSVHAGVERSSCPRIVTRSAWGARPARSTTRLSTPAPYAVVHHSATPSCPSESDCRSRIRSIQYHHMFNNSWSDIGYNFLIGGDGNVYEGRGWTKRGDHALGHNHHSLGICMIGTYGNTAPSTSMMIALYALLDCAQRSNYLTSTYKLLGHRQVRSTACPGYALYARLQRHGHYSNSHRR